MNTKLHIECYELLHSITEQFEGIKFEAFNDFGNSIRVSSENFFGENEDGSIRMHLDITIFPGHNNFAENYLHVVRTTYVNESPSEFMKDCIDIPCTYITDDYYDKRSKRHSTVLPKETFYKISKVLKDFKENSDHINLVIFHYYFSITVQL